DLPHTIVPASGEPKTIDGCAEQLEAGFIEPAVTRHQRRRERSIGGDACTGIALVLARARRGDARAHGGGWFALTSRPEHVRRHGRHLHGKVETVAQRTRHPPAVADDLERRAAALAREVAGESARAGVHRAD